MYEKGKGIGQGIGQSDWLAVHWYRKAAEQGNAAAQRSLRRMVRDGKGVEQSYHEAVQGHAGVQNNLQRMLRDGGAVGAK